MRHMHRTDTGVSIGYISGFILAGRKSNQFQKIQYVILWATFSKTGQRICFLTLISYHGLEYGGIYDRFAIEK